MRFKEEDIIFEDSIDAQDEEDKILAGYIWATDTLVELTDFNLKKRYDDDYINFYPTYYPETKDLKLIVCYAWARKEHEIFELSLSSEERNLIIEKMKNYGLSKFKLNIDQFNLRLS